MIGMFVFAAVCIVGAVVSVSTLLS